MGNLNKSAYRKLQSTLVKALTSTDIRLASPIINAILVADQSIYYVQNPMIKNVAQQFDVIAFIYSLLLDDVTSLFITNQVRHGTKDSYIKIIDSMMDALLDCVSAGYSHLYDRKTIEDAMTKRTDYFLDASADCETQAEVHKNLIKTFDSMLFFSESGNIFDSTSTQSPQHDSRVQQPEDFDEIVFGTLGAIKFYKDLKESVLNEKRCKQYSFFLKYVKRHG